jgi:hypothetical protein
VLGVRGAAALAGSAEDFKEEYLAADTEAQYMNCLFNIGAAYLYLKFNKWRAAGKPVDLQDGRSVPAALFLRLILDGKEIIPHSEHPIASVRVLNVLDRLYDGFDLNFEVINYIIINTQVELGSDPDEHTMLSELPGFPLKDLRLLYLHSTGDKVEYLGRSLENALHIVFRFRNDEAFSRAVSCNEITEQGTRKALFDVLKAFAFLKNVRFTVDKKTRFINMVETREENYEDITEE